MSNQKNNTNFRVGNFATVAAAYEQYFQKDSSLNSSLKFNSDKNSLVVKHSLFNTAPKPQPAPAMPFRLSTQRQAAYMQAFVGEVVQKHAPGAGA